MRPLNPKTLDGWARAINDSGMVAGTHTLFLEDDRPVTAPGVWRPGGEFVAIPLVPGVEIATQEPTGINNLGEVVGYTNLINHDNDAFYWSETEGVIDLQSALDASGAGWDLQWATDINEAGQIIGVARFRGGGFQGVLLTPVPEPGVAAPLIAMAAGIATLRRLRL